MYKFIITYVAMYANNISVFEVEARNENEALSKLYHSGEEVHHVQNVQRVLLGR